MITINLNDIEYYDGIKNEFVTIEGKPVRFEYSLKALYDWESKWKKPFLKGELSEAELMDFYLTMALDPIDPEFMTYEVMVQLAKYIEDSHTATTFSNHSEPGQNGVNKAKFSTAEELYAQMFTANIPLEFENRNLNRLFIILKIMATYNSPPKKMSKQDVLKQNRDLNAMRKAQLKTKG